MIDDHQPGRQAGIIYRNVEFVEGATLSGVDKNPQPDCDAERQQSQGQVLERSTPDPGPNRRLYLVCQSHRNPRLPFHLRDSYAARALNYAGSFRNDANTSDGSSPRFSSPSCAMEMEPSSSETTSTTASVSSVMPIAARCRVPSERLTLGFAESGSTHAADKIWSPLIITAPS